MLPVRYKIALRCMLKYATDMLAYLRHSGSSASCDRERRKMLRTIIETHSIEKGLSLSSPRPWFAQKRIENLIGTMSAEPIQAAGGISRAMLSGALHDYVSENRAATGSEPPIVRRIETFLAKEAELGVRPNGGIRFVSSLPREPDEQAIAFLDGRFSCRMFEPASMSDAQIADVIALAQRAPSQCNRQSSHVHAYRDPSRIRALLELQGGAASFEKEVGTLFVVTSDLTAWLGPMQRNQPYTDGGLFCMMLMLALQAYGFASTPLNLAVNNEDERAIRKVGDIPQRERLIMMIAAGRDAGGRVKAAKSPRRSVEETLELHDRAAKTSGYTGSA